MPPPLAPGIRHLLPPLIAPLRAYARALTGRAEAADDLVQEALLRALAAEAQFQPGTPLRAWVFTILRNHWRDTLRRRGRESRALQAVGQVAASPPDAPDVPAGLALDGLAAALHALPQAQREALLLVGAQGLSIIEVAAICGVPEGTVRVRISRGRAALRRALAPPPERRRAGTHATPENT
jgi:RNA polymerase sigma-70 factor (ECF subfamily)